MTFSDYQADGFYDEMFDGGGAPRLGVVRSTGINWSFPVLTQTIGVEGHA